MRLLKLALAGAFALALGAPAFAADDSVTAKNASGSTITFCGKDTGAGVMASCQIPVDTTGTKVNPAVSQAEDAAHTSGDKGTMALTVRKDTAASTAGSDGDYAGLTTDANGRLHANVVAAAGALAAGALVDGADLTQGAKADSSCGTDTGTCSAIALFKKIAANLTTLNTTLTSDPADGAADSGTSAKLGAKCATSEPAIETAADRVPLLADCVGKVVVTVGSLPASSVSGGTSAMTGTTSTSLIAAPAAGLRNYLTQITCGNSHATVGTFVNVQDGSGGTTIWTLPAAAVYGGATIHFSPPLRQPTTATAIFVADATTGANVICFGNGFKAP